MVINPALQEMTSEDLHRRYEDTFVRYDGQIVLIKSFSGHIKEQTIAFISREGFQESKFNALLLDISRPPPHWFFIGEEAKYICYSFERQFHRGFSRDNIIIRDNWGRTNGIPGFFDALTLFDEFYKVPLKRQRISFNEAKNTKETLILSPQILLTRDVENDSCVFFREKCIGKLGNVLPEFEQELTEVIGDYVNERPVGEVEIALRGVGGRKNNRKNAPRIHENVAGNFNLEEFLFDADRYQPPIIQAP